MSNLVYEKHFQIKETEDEIIKTSAQGWNIDKKWLEIYSEFRLFCIENNCEIIPIKVLDADKNSIVMEKIDSVSIIDHIQNIKNVEKKKKLDSNETVYSLNYNLKKKFILQSYQAALDFQKNLMMFNNTKDYYWNYKDFSLKNLHFTKDDKWYALDPDCWRAGKFMFINGWMNFNLTISQNLHLLYDT